MKRFEPKLRNVNGQLVYVGASGKHYALDDYDTAPKRSKPQSTCRRETGRSKRAKTNEVRIRQSAEALQAARDLHQQGWCLVGIARELDRRGLRGPRGGRFTFNAVKRMLAAKPTPR